MKILSELQGLDEACKGKIDSNLLDSFVAWIAEDVQKESKAEMEDNDLEWEKIQLPVKEKATSFYRLSNYISI